MKEVTAVRALVLSGESLVWSQEFADRHGTLAMSSKVSQGASARYHRRAGLSSSVRRFGALQRWFTAWLLISPRPPDRSHGTTISIAERWAFHQASSESTVRIEEDLGPHVTRGLAITDAALSCRSLGDVYHGPALKLPTGARSTRSTATDRTQA